MILVLYTGGPAEATATACKLMCIILMQGLAPVVGMHSCQWHMMLVLYTGGPAEATATACKTMCIVFKHGLAPVVGMHNCGIFCWCSTLEAQERQQLPHARQCVSFFCKVLHQLLACIAVAYDAGPLHWRLSRGPASYNHIEK